MLLICNGFLHPMTTADSFRGDILVDGGKILRVEKRIDPATLKLERVIDAAGLHITPGLIDSHTHLTNAMAQHEDDAQALTDAALAAGVTTVAVWPDADGETLTVCHGHECEASNLRYMAFGGMCEQKARQRMEKAHNDGETLAVQVNCAREMRLAVALCAETACCLVLAGVPGADLIEAVAGSGCKVLLDACSRRMGESAYEIAARLNCAGVTAAMASDYPAVRMHHLPLCAGLCVRAGLHGDMALRMITVNAAQILGISAQCGTIEAGKRADLALFDGDPLMLATDHVMTVCGGEVVS